MGQIFNRIKRIVSSYASDFEAKSAEIPDEDDELRKIIDELSEKKSKEEKTASEPNFNQKMSLSRAYQILNIENSASPQEIKAAYKKMIAKYHPDKVANLGEELQQLAEKKSREINLAYQLIAKEKGFNK